MAVLLYDADCGFCTRSANWLRRRHLGVSIEPLQRAGLRALGVDPERAQREIPFVVGDAAAIAGHLKTAASGAGAATSEPALTRTAARPSVSYGARAIARALLTGGPGWRVVGWVLLHPPVVWLAGPAYVLIARNRHRMPGASDSCRIE